MPKKSKKRVDYPQQLHKRVLKQELPLRFYSQLLRKFSLRFKKGSSYYYSGSKCIEVSRIKDDSEDIAKSLSIKEERECDPGIYRKSIEFDNTNIANQVYKKTTQAKSPLINSAGLLVTEDIKQFELINEYLGEIIMTNEFK